ncbi:MAG: hypothetical protein AAGA81_13100 [Acidobacteriota bacterium]
MSARRIALTLVYALCAVGLMTPLLGLGGPAQLLLGLPASMVWVVGCLGAVFVAQLLVYREDGDREHPWEAEAEPSEDA